MFSVSKLVAILEKIPAPHLDLHTLTSPRGLVIPKGAKIQKIRSLLGSRAQLG